MAVRAVRGATQVDADDRDAIIEATAELVRTVLERNGLTGEELISIIFTTTPDLVAEFPAYAARSIGMTDVPFLCASEIAVPEAMPRVIRLMALVDAEFSRAEARHVYLRGAAALRTDLPRD
jgi:chorismate mutase